MVEKGALDKDSEPLKQFGYDAIRMSA